MIQNDETYTLCVLIYNYVKVKHTETQKKN